MIKSVPLQKKKSFENASLEPCRANPAHHGKFSGASGYVKLLLSSNIRRNTSERGVTGSKPENIFLHPAQIHTVMSAVAAVPVNSEKVLFYIRMASCNQILDPWIYIMCHVTRLRRVKKKVESNCQMDTTIPQFSHPASFPSMVMVLHHSLHRSASSPSLIEF